MTGFFTSSVVVTAGSVFGAVVVVVVAAGGFAVVVVAAVAAAVTAAAVIAAVVAADVVDASAEDEVSDPDNDVCVDAEDTVSSVTGFSVSGGVVSSVCTVSAVCGSVSRLSIFSAWLAQAENSMAAAAAREINAFLCFILLPFLFAGVEVYSI